MNTDFNAGDNLNRSGKSRSSKPDENTKNGKEEKEDFKTFASRTRENQKSRPKRPRTTRLRPGETRPYDAANNRRTPSEERSDRPYHDRSAFSFGDRENNQRSRDDRPWGARKPFSQKPGDDRRSNRPGDGRSNFNPNRSSDRRDGFENSRRSPGSGRPARDGNSFSRNENRGPRDGNRGPRDGNRGPRDGNRADSGNYNRDYREKPKFRNNNAKPPYKKFSKPKKDSETQDAPIKREFNDAGEMRLNRYLAHAGICSRRQADDYIKAGLVTVNGAVITEMGVKIKRGDDIRYNGERLATEKKVYILLNKPKDYVTSTDDELGRKTVMDIIGDACPERLYPVGRLDRNTTGVILLTNDGDMAGKLTHPKYNKKKIYHVVLDKNLKQADLQSITDGITLEDGFIQPDAVSWVSPEKKHEVGIEIHSGKNRIVRRIFEQLGYDIIRLDRVYFAGLTKKNLARGKWRFLSEKEISMLQMNSYE